MCSHLLTLFSGGAWVVNLQHESMGLNLLNTECAMWLFIFFVRILFKISFLLSTAVTLLWEYDAGLSC